MNKYARVAIEIGVPTALFSGLSIFPIQQGLMPWWMFGVIFVEASCLQILFRNIYPQVRFQRSLGSGDSSFIALLSTLVVGILVMIPLLMSEEGILVPTPELTWWSYAGGSILLAVWTIWSLWDIKTKKVLIEGHWDPSRYLRAVQMEEFAGGELLLVPRDGLEVVAWEVETFHNVSLEYSWIVFYQDEFVNKPALKVKMTIRTEHLYPGMLFLKEKEILRRGKEVFWAERDPCLLERIHKGVWFDKISTKESLPPVLKKDGAEIPVRWSVEAIY